MFLRLFVGLLFVSYFSNCSAHAQIIKQSTQLLSRDSRGNPLSGANLVVDVSDKGQVVFYSMAQLDRRGRDQNSKMDLYVSHASGGFDVVNFRANGSRFEVHHPRIDPTGAFLVFNTDAALDSSRDRNGKQDIYRHLIGVPGFFTLLSVGAQGRAANGDSEWPDISAQGKVVVFHSMATDLVTGDNNDTWDVFARVALSTGNKIHRVSVDQGFNEVFYGSLFPAVSYSGNFVSFVSFAQGLTPFIPVVVGSPPPPQVYARKIEGLQKANGKLGTLKLVSMAFSPRHNHWVHGWHESGGSSVRPSIADNGRVVFQTHDHELWPYNGPDPQQGTPDLVYWDWDAPRVPVPPNKAGISREGMIMGMVASDEAGVMGSGDPSRSVGLVGTDSFWGRINKKSGRYIVFQSRSENLLTIGDTNRIADIFVKDVTTGQVRLASQSSTGQRAVSAIGGSDMPALSASGRFVAFSTNASNMVSQTLPSHPNLNVLLRDRGQLTTNLGGACGSRPFMEVDAPHIAENWNIRGKTSFVRSSGVLYASSSVSGPGFPLGNGCRIHIDPASYVALPISTDSTGNFSLKNRIANDPSLVGLQFNLQGAFGHSFSAASKAQVGY